MGRLDGKIALVTGSSRGIGRGIALQFARDGADVVVNYRRDDVAAAETVGAIEDLGRRAVALQADVSEWAQVESLVARTLGHMPIEEWHRVININLNGVFYTCKATAKHLVDRKQGVLLLVSSIGADACSPFGAPYYASKAAVNALTKTLAKECAPAGVRVNCIAPGLVATDMGDRMMKFYGDALVSGIPLGRPGAPEDIGKAAAYLASDDAAFVTGKILRIDGGAWM
jgi:3-oxoacyl-[acyl-carrier protein] reductase